MPHPLHMFNENLAQLGKKSNSVIRSRSVMVKNCCNVLSMEGVTVCGHHPECHVTFGRGGLILFGNIPRTDHRTSLETISNVPWHIPARKAYWKLSRDISGFLFCIFSPMKYSSHTSHDLDYFKPGKRSDGCI